jgi:hypothetical protein
VTVRVALGLKETVGGTVGVSVVEAVRVGKTRVAVEIGEEVFEGEFVKDGVGVRVFVRVKITVVEVGVIV